jgi:hypothetical protein
MTARSPCVPTFANKSRQRRYCGASIHCSSVEIKYYDHPERFLDNLEEAVSGVKGALAVKIYGDDRARYGYRAPVRGCRR